MDITYTLNVLNIYTKSTDSLADIVSLVEWELVGVVNNNNSKAVLKGQTNLSSPTADNFVAFDDLSQEQVTEWIIANDPDATLFKQHIEIILNKEIYLSQLELKWLPWEADPFRYVADTGGN